MLFFGIVILAGGIALTRYRHEFVELLRSATPERWTENYWRRKEWVVAVIGIAFALTGLLSTIVGVVNLASN